MADEQVIQAGTRRPCCQNEDNLVEHQTNKPELIVRICKVCSARHFELNAEPGVIGIVGASL